MNTRHQRWFDAPDFLAGSFTEGMDWLGSRAPEWGSLTCPWCCTAFTTPELKSFRSPRSGASEVPGVSCSVSRLHEPFRSLQGFSKPRDPNPPLCLSLGSDQLFGSLHLSSATPREPSRRGGRSSDPPNALGGRTTWTGARGTSQALWVRHCKAIKVKIRQLITGLGRFSESHLSSLCAFALPAT